MRSKRIAAAAVAMAATVAGLVGPGRGPIPAVHAATPAITSFAFTPNPIATTGTLGANATQDVVVQAKSGPNGIDSATIYLKFDAAAGGGSATATDGNNVTTPLSGTTPQPFIADSSGDVTVHYTTGPNPPASGTDTITASDAATSPTVTATDTYRYAKYSGLSWGPAGTRLADGPGNTLTVSTGNAQTVWLRIVHSGSGTVGTATSGVTPLSGTYQSFTTNSSGQLTVSFAHNPLTSTGTDTVTAVDDPATSEVQASVTYSYTGTGLVNSYRFLTSPIAQAGSIPNAGTVSITVEADDPTGAPVSMAPGFFSITSSNGSTLTAASHVIHNGDAAFQTTFNSSGQISVVFTFGGGSPGTLDMITVSKTGAAINPPTNPGTTDFYNPDAVARFVLSTDKTVKVPGNIADPTTLNDANHTNNTANLTVQALDGQTPAHAVPHAIAFVNFSPTTGGGALSVNGTGQGSTAAGYETDASGNVGGVYVAGTGTYPTGGQDIVNVATNSALTAASASIVYDFGAATVYTMVPNPIGPFGSIAPGATRTIILSPVDAYNSPPDASTPVDSTVYLSFLPNSGDNAAAKIGACSGNGTALTATPQPFTTSSHSLTICYTAPNPLPSGAGSPPPADQITAADAVNNPVVSVNDSYSFLTTSQVHFPNADPTTHDSLIAPAGNLAKGTVFSGSGGPTPAIALSTPGKLFLSFTPGPGSTATAAAHDALSGNFIPLSSTPQLIKPDNTNTISINYTSSSPLPAGGADVITAQNAATNPTVTIHDTYTYTGRLVFDANPIAASGALAEGASPTFTVVAEDGSGAALGSGVPVFLSFAGTSGSATVAATPLTSTPQPFLTNSSGVVTITYSTPVNSLPNSGTDAVLAGNDTPPTVVAATRYTYPTVANFGFTPFPLAIPGSLGSDQTVHATMQLLDVVGNPIAHVHTVYLSLFNSPTTGTAIAAGHPLSSTAQPIPTDANGQIAITYTAPHTLPRSGVDFIFAGDVADPNTATIFGLDGYRFHPVQGYWLVASDGGIFPFGDAVGHGSHGGSPLNQPIVGMAPTPDGGGYWLVASDGGIFPYGDARGFGSHGGSHLNSPIVGMAATPDGDGYWLVAADGGIFPYGDAGGFGSHGGSPLNKPIVGMAATTDGRGYYLVASDGGIFPYGDALQQSYGSTGGTHLNQPIVGMAVNPLGGGYWLVASDGGIFPFGPNAGGFGSTGRITLNKPIVGMAPSFDGNGYYLVASDGGIFPFGDAVGAGSTGGQPLNKPIVGMAAIG